MEDFLQVMQQHTSVRDFQDRALDEATKQKLITAARSNASSNFVQAFSILEIQNATLRRNLGQLANCEPYVVHSGVFYVFIADLYRQKVLLEQNQQSIASLTNLESLLVSVVDTTISAQSMVIAAEQLGLGICYIGGIRNDLFKVAEWLNLPPLTVPLFGLTIGYPQTKNQMKPRLPLANQVGMDTYPRQQFADLTAYQAQTATYYRARTQNAQQSDWLQKNRAFFEEIRRPEVAKFVRQQGFVL